MKRRSRRNRNEVKEGKQEEQKETNNLHVIIYLLSSNSAILMRQMSTSV